MQTTHKYLILMMSSKSRKIDRFLHIRKYPKKKILLKLKKHNNMKKLLQTCNIYKKLLL